MQHPDLIYAPSRRVVAADTLIGGDILRIVLSGMPDLQATNAIEALRELRREHEDFRRFLINPPRGHEDINACLLLPPFSSDAVRTLVVAAQFGYAPIAGTALMAASAVLVQTGQAAATGARATLPFDTAKGKAEVAVDVADGRCVSATWSTHPPRVIARDREFVLGDGRRVRASVITSGLPYVVASASDLRLDMRDSHRLGAAGADLSRAAGAQLPLGDVGLAEDADAYIVMIVGRPELWAAESTTSVPAAWVSSTGWVAPSPSGTGALAVAAYLAETGVLDPEMALEVVTPAGNGFRCWLDGPTASVRASVEITALLELIADTRF